MGNGTSRQTGQSLLNRALCWRSSGHVGNTTPLAAWQHRSLHLSEDLLPLTTLAAAVLELSELWPLPRLATWNVRALFHAGAALQEKMNVVTQLLAHTDVLCLQETHAMGPHDFAAVGAFRHHRIYQSSCPNFRAGGVAILLRVCLA